MADRHQARLLCMSGRTEIFSFWCAYSDGMAPSRTTQDRTSMIGFARARIAAGLPMPGLFALRPRTTVAQAIDAVLLVDFCSDQDEWQNRIEFLPL